MTTKDPTACEDFFMVVIEANVISVVMKEFQLDTFDGVPKSAVFSEKNFLKHNKGHRNSVFMDAVSNVVKKFVYYFDMKTRSREADKALIYSKIFL